MGRRGDERMRGGEDERMGRWEEERMREWENERRRGCEERTECRSGLGAFAPGR